MPTKETKTVYKAFSHRGTMAWNMPRYRTVEVCADSAEDALSFVERTEGVKGALVVGDL